ncbi:MAG: nucleotidyl transferase AbiEii/AbiGii toxin family protein [Longimicrobiaceae bacterium]
MDNVAQWAPDDRAALFQETAVRRGVVPTIVEKDFWVCWTLRRLFAHPERRPAMLFKGGTSLSKVYGVIERFSEDIDLSIDRHDLGFSGERDPENVGGRRAREKLLKELKVACVDYLATECVPRNIVDFESVLGSHGEGWSLEIDAGDDQTVLFRYPSTTDGGVAPYIHKVVRMEFGARSDFWPATGAEIRSYAAEEFPDQFQEPLAKIRVLEAKRTFWEKATILHAEFHRQNRNLGAERLSRHYYDLARLATSPMRHEALGDLELLSEVAHHKEFFFATAWARYNEARPGTLRLVPPDDLRRLLESDYRQMSEMFFGEQPAFGEVLSTLGELEREINGTG